MMIIPRSSAVLCLSLFFLASQQTTLVTAIDVAGRIAWNTVLPDISQVSIDTKVSLQSTTIKQAYIRKDGSFLFQNVSPGKYILRVRCHEFAFPSLIVEVPSYEGEEVTTIIPIIKPHVFGQADPPQNSPGSPPLEPHLRYPIQLTPLVRLQYEEIVQGFNPIAMLLGNPMYLLMGGMALLMMLMPKLMNMIDPEALAEVQANQASMHKQMASIQDMDLASGLTRMLSSSVDTAPESSSKASSGPGKTTKTPNSVKKRK